MLSFELLGNVVLSKCGRPLSHFRSQKELALLIYLAQTAQSHRRDFIADLLWDGRSTQQALTNLRTVLARLRNQVGDALVVTRQTVALAPEQVQEVDARRLLEGLAATGRLDSGDRALTLQTALASYRGEFLADFQLRDAPRFDAWMLATRADIHGQVMAAYGKLGRYLLARGDGGHGIPLAHAWLRVDPLDEAAHMLLIQLLLAAGDVRQAVAHYDRCADLLQKELGIEPPAEMTALIRTVSSRGPITPQPAAAARHNLPGAYDPFFGRQVVQQEIHSRLDQTWCRLVTIVGQGGVGKTRLAITVARRRVPRYRDGVWLVELADVDPDDDALVEALAVEIATALDLRLSGAAKPVEQLLAHLQHKEMLLVLDNFEHLLPGVPLILALLQRCDAVQMLITSREPLRMRAEWTIALHGLDYPASALDELPSAAVDLFAARCAQQRWGAMLAADLTTVREICRLVEGLPLALELAAALTREMSIEEVATHLRAGFDVLTARLRDVPRRHQNLQVVFDTSWHALSPPLQQRLAQLSLFRSGFTAAAARAVGEAELHHLAALREKSLLMRDEATGRYMLHAVVRAYAAAKRPATDLGLANHARYYLALLASHAEPLQKDRPQDSVEAIQPEMENVRLAWQTGLARRQVDLLTDALAPLSIYYQLRGLAHEAEAVMHSTLRTAATWGVAGQGLAIRAGLERARFQNRLGRYRPAVQTLQATLERAGQSGDRWAEGMGSVLWGEALWRQGEYEPARARLVHALELAQALDDAQLMGWCYHHLGVIHDNQGRYDAALDHLEQACAAWKVGENVQGLSGSLNSISLVCLHRGDLPAARHAMEQALALCEQLGDRHRQSVLLNNLSLMATEQEEYFAAHHYLQRGLGLATTSGNLTSQGEIYSNLGQTYRQLGQTDQAVESLRQGLQIAESIGNRHLAAIAMLHLADIKGEEGDPEAAETWYRQALAIAQQDELRETECTVLLNLAELLTRRSEREARQYSTQAVALAQALQNPDLARRAQALHGYLTIAADGNGADFTR